MCAVKGKIRAAVLRKGRYVEMHRLGTQQGEVAGQSISLTYCRENDPEQLQELRLAYILLQSAV